ncbi:unnamed protein product [Hydatigera taeniaeformis]|uniref:Secreted protein n=1 Tax=Hydatigena taeniaeformis TaxID=6205 RepID=A0A0R3WMN8_HYDTA|nr:unnamed protein product [Hydatigera taeniaeformis]
MGAAPFSVLSLIVPLFGTNCVRACVPVLPLPTFPPTYLSLLRPLSFLLSALVQVLLLLLLGMNSSGLDSFIPFLVCVWLGANHCGCALVFGAKSIF